MPKEGSAQRGAIGAKPQNQVILSITAKSSEF